VGLPDGSVRLAGRVVDDDGPDGVQRRAAAREGGDGRREGGHRGEARTIADDGSPYVAIAVRPKLPRFQEGRRSGLHVIVVDSSRSMIGERFARAHSAWRRAIVK
jgi:Mg-chelatase subunit ChlD